VFFLSRRNSRGDAMAESRGKNEDMRLKGEFLRLWEQGTDHVGPGQFQNALTSKRPNVKQKANNISGLQLADLLVTTPLSSLFSRAIAGWGNAIQYAPQDLFEREGT